jgi:hypothetical protein
LKLTTTTSTGSQEASLQKYDGCEITGGEKSSLTVEATSVEETEHGPLAHFLMFTMKEQPGSGRRDL